MNSTQAAQNVCEPVYTSLVDSHGYKPVDGSWTSEPSPFPPLSIITKCRRYMECQPFPPSRTSGVETPLSSPPGPIHLVSFLFSLQAGKCSRLQEKENAKNLTRNSKISINPAMVFNYIAAKMKRVCSKCSRAGTFLMPWSQDRTFFLAKEMLNIFYIYIIIYIFII